jgi:hypothetical protein
MVWLLQYESMLKSVRCFVRFLLIYVYVGIIYFIQLCTRFRVVIQDNVLSDMSAYVAVSVSLLHYRLSLSAVRCCAMNNSAIRRLRYVNFCFDLSKEEAVSVLIHCSVTLFFFNEPLSSEFSFSQFPLFTGQGSCKNFLSTQVQW